MALNGLFLSFEGIDGAGKSSHIDALAKAFTEQGRAVTMTREPGGTPLAEKLRAMVLNDAMDPLTEALLIFAARRDHLTLVIEPALARGDVVLCDRFTDASFAYQGFGRGFDLTVLSTLERWVQASHAVMADSAQDSSLLALRQPHLTLWFDLAPEIAAARLVDARVPDKFESQPLAFFQKVVAGYAARAAADPQRFARVDAAAARHAVWQQITRVLIQKGWLSFMVAARP